MDKISIDSEIGMLKLVLLHRPDVGLSKLTANNCGDYLIDDVLQVDEAIKEHNQFTQVLENHGTKTLFLMDLLTETLQSKEAKEWLLSKHCTDFHLGPVLATELKSYLSYLPNCKLARHLIDGLAISDIDADTLHNHFSNLSNQELSQHDFIIPPAPNHLFTRDASFVLQHSIVLSSIQNPVRRVETVNLEAIYTFHPLFRSIAPTIWCMNHFTDDQHTTLEGGDVLMIGKGKVLIGISERTTKAGIENLAKTLFNDGCIHEVVIVEVIPGRATMHLDTVLTMIDYDKFAYYQHAIHENTRSWSIRPSHSQGMSIHENINFFRTLSRITGNKRVTMVPTGGSFFRSQQEQWNDAVNLLTLSPGNVVCYSKNKNTIRNLIEHDIRVTLVPGDELGKGRGGPRCMSCPLIRSPL